MALPGLASVRAEDKDTNKAPVLQEAPEFINLKRKILFTTWEGI